MHIHKQEVNISSIGGGTIGKPVVGNAENYIMWVDDFGKERYAPYTPEVAEYFLKAEEIKNQREAGYKNDIYQDYSKEIIQNLDDKADGLRRKISFIYSRITAYITDETNKADSYFEEYYKLKRPNIEGLCTQCHEMHKSFLKDNNLYRYYRSNQPSNALCQRDYQLDSSSLSNIGNIPKLEKLMFDYMDFQLEIVNLVGSVLPTASNRMYTANPFDTNLYYVESDSQYASENIYTPQKSEVSYYPEVIPETIYIPDPPKYHAPDITIFSVVDSYPGKVSNLATYPKLDNQDRLFMFAIIAQDTTANVVMYDYEGLLFNISFSPAPIGKTAIKTVLSGSHVKISIADQTGLRITKTGIRSTRDVTFDHKRIIGT